MKLNVPDMSCGHCKARVETAITSVDGAAKTTVDLIDRVVEVKTTADPAAILGALKAAGYPSTVSR